MISFENDEPRDRTEYNRRIQEVQSLGIETTVEARHRKSGPDAGLIWAANFYVLWGSERVLVGEAIPPFEERAKFYWYGDKLRPLVSAFLDGISGRPPR